MLHHLLGAACLMAALSGAHAVQDPKASAAQLDSRIAAVKVELAKVEQQLATPKLLSNERKSLQNKRASLLKEQQSLAMDRARNEKTSGNPLVVYSDDTPTNDDANRIDALFK